MKYIKTLTEKGKLKWHDSDAPDADGRFRDLSPKDLAAWLIKTRKGDMKKISGSLSQQVAFNKNDDPEYAKKMDKTRIEVYKQMDREDLLESINEAKMPKKYIGNDEIVFLKTKEDSRGAHYNLYYKGHDIEKGGVRFGSEKELEDFASNYILSNQLYKKLRYEDSIPLPESVDMDDLENAKERLSNPHTILDITYDKTRRGDKFVRFDYENKYVPGKMLDSGPHFVNVRYDNNKDLKKISKELNMDLKESVLNEEDTWNDYPAAAKKNAQKAIDWKEKYGRDEVDAGTPVGWARAHQLAKGENLSTDTVKRMSAFNRHRKNSSIKPELKETPWKDRGYVAWLIWGGDEGVDWAIEKSKEIDAMKEAKQMKYIKPLHEAFVGPFVFNDKMSDDELKAMYSGALDGYSYYAKGMQYSKSDYKKAYQEIEKILNKRGVDVNEAKRSTVHRAAKKGSYPAVIVVVQDGKVIHQEPVSTPDVAPATFNVMQEKYPKALLHLEDKTGKRLFSESVVNEARMFYLIGDKEVSRDEMLTYKYDNPDKPVAKEGWPKWLYTNNDPKGKTLKWSTIKKDMKGLEKHYGEGNVVVGGRTNAGGPYIEIYSKSQNESVTEGIYAKKSKIQVGEYIKTQYGYFYKRVEGKVGGQDAYVEIKKGKEGKRKTSIHDTVDFDIVDKDTAFESVVTEGMSKSAIKKAIKVIDQQIEDEEGGDGEPLDNETLQALEQERERLLKMNESKFSPLGYAKRVISGEISLKAAMKEAGISFKNISKLIKQIDKSFDLDAAIAENRKYIKTLNEGYWSHYDYEKWTKENGKPKYPKWVKTTLKEIVKGGFMESHYDAEHMYMVLWLASLENKRRSELYAYDKKGVKEFGKVGYAMYQRFYNDLTSYNMFFMQGAMYALEVSKHIQDRIANGEPVEPAYYMMKEYFNGFGMDTKRSRVFNAAYEKLEKWMKDNQIKTL